MNAKMLELPAVFSPDRAYRYTLRRDWLYSSSPRMVAFIGLNPSTADEVKNDPTVTRCVKYAQKWGFAGMFMLNIFAYRSTNPQALYRVEDPVGPWNDDYIIAAVKESELVVACWGNHGGLMSRGWDVIRLVQGAGENLSRLGPLTIPGQPRHPLYLKSSLRPEQL